MTKRRLFMMRLFLIASVITMVIAIPLVLFYSHSNNRVAEIILYSPALMSEQDDLVPTSEPLPIASAAGQALDSSNTDFSAAHNYVDISTLTQLRGSDLSIGVAFGIYRVQVALSLGMDLDTFFFGDTSAWIEEYLYQWRRANNIPIMPDYDGPIAAAPDYDGGFRIYSIVTQEYLFSLAPLCDEERRLIHIVHLLRDPFMFGPMDEDRLSFLMRSTLGVSSFDELLATTPLYYLQTFMVNEGLTFRYIANDWLNSGPITQHPYPTPTPPLDTSSEERQSAPIPCEEEPLR